MTDTIKINPSSKTVTLLSLVVGNPDFFSVIEAQPEATREQVALDIIAVGSAAFQRVRTTVDADFIEKRFAGLALRFGQALDGLQKKLNEEVAKRFSPTESGSYIKSIGDLVKSAKDDLSAKSRELEGLLDPDKKSSAVGRLDELVEDTAEQFEKMFDPEVKGSYAATLSQQLSKIFGENGQPGVLGSKLQDALQPVLRELRELKEKVEGRKAAEQVIASSALKGRPFEELVFQRLSQLAQPFGDEVTSVGNGNGGTRAGDILVAVNGSGKRIVVEARDRKQMSLPAIKGDLEREMTERDADLAIYVSSGADMLPQHVGDFQLYGDKVVTTLGNLHIGYRLARLLVLSQSPDGDVDLAALRAVLSKVKDAARTLRDVKSKASQVRKFADGIHADAESVEREIFGLLDEAESILTIEAAA